jgi:hypothetical protein
MALTEAEIRRITRKTIATAPVVQPPASLSERASHAPYRRMSIHKAVREAGTNVTTTVRAIIDDEISKVVADPSRLATEMPAPIPEPIAVSAIEDRNDPYEPWDPRWPPLLKRGVKRALWILERGL